MLVNAVLMSLHSYWAQMVLIPKSVLHRITQICRVFLWKGKVYLTKPPIVAWKWVCKTKSQGGPGIRNCVNWNVAALGKYVWFLVNRPEMM